MVLREPSSSQIFFVNVPILKDGLKNNRRLANTLFTTTASDSPKCIPCPQGVKDALAFMVEYLENVQTRTPDDTAAVAVVGIDLLPMSTSDAIALAGYLLEYQVSYAPSSSSSIDGIHLFLSNVPLTIVNVTLVSSDGRYVIPTLDFYIS